MLFHVGIGAVAGGFVGVDVFFVISGFLITGNLASEAKATGTVRLAAFWARRVRRLAPALALTLACTLAVCVAVTSPLAWGDFGRSAGASAAYVSNLLFGWQADAYFTSGADPFLHTWSLSVEEQFYLGWPLLILFAATTSRLVRRSQRRVVLGTLAVVAVASMIINIVLTQRGTPWSFYATPGRAWEFAVGGMTAIVFEKRAMTERLSALGATVGLAAIITAALSFDSLTRFPGTAALLPVAGTALVLAPRARHLRWAPTRLLELRTLRYVGRVSYSWYLWHWPAIVFADMLLDKPSNGTRAAAVLAAFCLAAVTYRWVEHPLRVARPWQTPRRALSIGLAVSLLVIAGSVGINRVAAERMRTDRLARLIEARDGRSETVTAACVTRSLAGREECVFGAADSTTTILLVGDSHAAQWSSAVIEAAKELDAAVITRIRGGCPSPPDLYIRATGSPTASPACIDLRHETAGLIERVRPDLVVISNADYRTRTLTAPAGDLLSADDAMQRAADETADQIASIEALGVRVAVIGNNPDAPRDPIECLAFHDSVSRCSAIASEAIAPVIAANEFLASSLHAKGLELTPRFFDPVTYICNAELCPVDTGEYVVYADGNHLTTAFTNSLAQEVRGLLQRMLS